LTWDPTSWRSRPAQQQPTYADAAALERAVADLARLPPIVVSWEVDALKKQIAEAQEGRRFILQGGDCAETFEDCASDRIARKLKILLQMSLVLIFGMKQPVTRIGRMAGQYAKPRSADLETRDGVTLPSYRGANVNRPAFTAQDREPDPELLLRGYERSALTLNFVRALVDGGFADLHHPEYWNLDFVQQSPLKDGYRRIVESLSDSLNFFEAVHGAAIHEVNRVDFFTSHEGLHLTAEAAQTRFIARRNRWYNLSTHLPWIGMRTAALDGAHVELFRGVSNPLGVKVGGSMTPDWLKGLLDRLNPDDEAGRIVLIARFGADDVDAKLPPLIEAVRGRRVLWMSDPMHGNTETTASGIKTRRFDRILTELEASFRVHRAHGSRLGGVHFELTGDDVTECNTSTVDPRLNHQQALEMAMRVADYARTH
jgi:3-deoxy-7-phosphoheptulonate synthase